MKFKSDLSDEAISQGFVQQYDMFHRKDLALRITGLFQQLEHGSVCLLDGRWGTGKSTFVRQWAAELKNHNIPSVYFDAFSSDYIESPFEALAGTFIQAATDARRQDQPAYKNFLSKAAAVGKTIASVSAKVGVKAATLGALNAADLDELGKVKDILTDGMGDVSENAVKRMLESHATRQSQFIELKKSLEELPRLLQPNQSGESDGPLVVFIDELDRCRPDFSLGTLEVLKHFFRADCLHFVLVTNRQHLQMSVERRYGVGAASAEYLEKFYDFVVFYEHSYEQHSEGSVTTFVEATLTRMLPAQTQDARDIRDYVRAMAIAFRMTLRQIQALSVNIAIAYLAALDREFRPAALISFLALIKSLRPDLYRKAKTQNLTWEEVRDFVVQVKWDRFDIGRVVSAFRYHLDENLDVNAPEWQGYGSSLWNYNLDRENVIAYLANGVMDRFSSPIEMRETDR